MSNTILGWTLLHFLWQGTALAAVMLGGLLATRSPRTRYSLGCGVLAAMALAPVVTYAVLAQPGAVTELPPVALALGAGDGLSRAVRGEAPAQWIAWVPLFWLSGVMALSLRLGMAAWGVHRLTHRDAREIPDAWPHLSAALGVRRRVRFLESRREAGPFQAGFLKPVILMPASLLTQLPVAQLEAIVAHELAHVVRHDYLVNLLQTLVETVLFYHPAVWWVSRTVRLEREVCCDQRAAEVVGGERPYAEALLNLEELAMGRFTLANGANGGDLRRRILRLLGQPDAPRRDWRVPAGLMAMVLVGAMVFPLVETRAQVQPPAPGEAAVSPSETEVLRLEVERLRKDLAELRAETAARIQQRSNAEQLSAIEAQRLSLTDAQRSLERLRESQDALLNAQDQALAMQLREADLLRARRTELEARLLQLAQIYRPSHPEYQRAARELALLPAAAKPAQDGYDKWLHEDVVYLITPAEAERFEQLKSDAEREMFVEQFWKRRDPKPDTAANEFKEEHYRRIGYANRRWGTPALQGWKTERGRRYIVSGPPDEIESHPGIKEHWLYRNPRQIVEFKLNDEK